MRFKSGKHEGMITEQVALAEPHFAQWTIEHYPDSPHGQAFSRFCFSGATNVIRAMRPRQLGQFDELSLMGGLLGLRDALAARTEECLTDRCAGDCHLRTDLINVISVHTAGKGVRIVRKVCCSSKCFFMKVKDLWSSGRAHG